MLNIYLIIK